MIELVKNNIIKTLWCVGNRRLLWVKKYSSL